MSESTYTVTPEQINSQQWIEINGIQLRLVTSEIVAPRSNTLYLVTRSHRPTKAIVSLSQQQGHDVKTESAFVQPSEKTTRCTPIESIGADNDIALHVRNDHIDELVAYMCLFARRNDHPDCEHVGVFLLGCEDRKAAHGFCFGNLKDSTKHLVGRYIMGTEDIEHYRPSSAYAGTGRNTAELLNELRSLYRNSKLWQRQFAGA
ncbi:hypothetical protein [Alteromonas macleodii]|uniref:Uncharacterized protein n=1 Tax=Alteromonas macleodii TaxID=28108 RepID=A0AB36FM61_ALTMA|nr:hypothetical protein [Alteromonas macleodii]OES24141.1 hypothetical protein BFV93_4741 [Alteromonas macleodii]OES24775.1 hypothetical protein BFV95_4534 [Alteromonas macleodii]OES25053.1 hypothetical protein BFV94_4524 [Alteromonas macleodii]OES39096.1 hypothetical protein BFV96_4244 [Alteromonas macleodii]